MLGVRRRRRCRPRSVISLMMMLSMAVTALKAPQHFRTVDNFYAAASELRQTFDAHFSEPRQAHPMRFVWDYWHVPDQYTLHRTQAADYFDPDEFKALTDALTAYGQRELGCRAISPPWLSFYTSGCEQALHADVPQGPLAYVLSLTKWDERQFSGGETAILQPQVLDYWRGFNSGEGLEYADLISLVPPLFNRLTIFDARVPHGVRRVEGEQDPRGARLVLHGWFTEPEPFFDGALDEAQVEQGLGPSLTRCIEAISPPCVTGLLSIRLDIAPEGTVSKVDTLVDLLVVDPSQLQSATAADAPDARDRVVRTIQAELRKATFEPCDKPSQITIPFSFD